MNLLISLEGDIRPVLCGIGGVPAQVLLGNLVGAPGLADDGALDGAALSASRGPINDETIGG